jgi:hypothetical protein
MKTVRRGRCADSVRVAGFLFVLLISEELRAVSDGDVR